MPLGWEQAREKMAEKIATLTPEESEHLRTLTLGARLKWVLAYLQENYPRMFSIRAVAEQSGTITATGLYQLISGQTKNPSFNALRGLAETLGIPLAFLAGRMDVMPEVQPFQFPPELQVVLNKEKGIEAVRIAAEAVLEAQELKIPMDTFMEVCRQTLRELAQGLKRQSR